MRKSQEQYTFYIFFIHFFFLWWILKFLQIRGARGFFFDLLIYYFINIVIKILYSSSFIVGYVIYFRKLILLCFDVFFPSPEKWPFGRNKWIFSHSFWPKWLKQTSFYRELNYLDSQSFSFSVFHLFPLKTTQNKTNII